MKSEKLKKLIKDKVPLKFRIKDAEQSIALQEFLFSLDVCWFFETGCKVINSTEEPYLYYNSSGLNAITWGAPCQERCFKASNIKEFDLLNDCLFEEKEEIIKITWTDLECLIDNKFEIFKKLIKESL